jgi:hypothetical protein
MILIVCAFRRIIPPFDLTVLLATQIDLHPQDGTQAQPDALITSFMFFQIFGGHLGIPIILLTTALSKTIQRRAILTSFLVTWVIYTMSYTLL